MSYRRTKNARRRKTMRGPSRPVDPRYAPGGLPRRRVDTFGIALMTVSGLALLLLVFLLLNRGQPSTQTTTNLAFPTATVDPTQQAITFATQTAPDILPRISLEDTKALYDAGNVRIIDVRVANIYQQGHIKGAVNVPHDQVAVKIKEVPKTGNIVLYCQ
jgi:Rhodanese-like domain